MQFLNVSYICHTASPPVPNPPRITSKGSSWIQVAWSALDCDGGYQIQAYDVEYKTRSSFSYFYTTAGRVSGLSYTIRNLLPSTEYDVRVQAVSRISLRERSSSFISVTTDPAGIKNLHSVQFDLFLFNLCSCICSYLGCK